MFSNKPFTESFPRVMALCVIAIGTGALLGRLVDSTALVSVAASMYPIRVNAAICLVLSGIALWVLTAPNYSLGHRAVVLTIVLAVLVIAVVTAAEHVLDTDFGIDELLFAESTGPQGQYPSRIPPVATLYLVLIAIALLAVDAERTRLVAHILAVAIASTVVFALVGLGYGTFTHGHWKSLWAVSIHGSFALLLLAAGVFALRPSGGLFSVLGVGPKQAAIALLALLVLFGVTSWSRFEAREYLARIANAEFDADVTGIKAQIEERFEKHAAVLAGVRSFMATDARYRERAVWRRYVERLNVDSLLPGILTVGFAPMISQEMLVNHVTRMRAEGYPEYKIWPPQHGARVVPVSYLEPIRARSLSALGFDMFSEPMRRAAMLAAIDSGEPTVSGRIGLIGEDLASDIGQPGFIVYLAYYRPDAPRRTVEERRTAVAGFVYSPLRAHDFFTSSLQRMEPDLGFEIFDGETPTDQGVLYRSVSRPSAANETQRAIPMTVGGHRWTMRAYTRPGTSAGRARALLPDALLVGGSAVSILLVGLGLALTKLRAKSP